MTVAVPTTDELTLNIKEEIHVRASLACPVPEWC